jgi:hypothetical protein
MNFILFLTMIAVSNKQIHYFRARITKYILDKRKIIKKYE